MTSNGLLPFSSLFEQDPDPSHGWHGHTNGDSILKRNKYQFQKSKEDNHLRLKTSTHLERLTGPVIPISGILLSTFFIYECGITAVAFGVVSIMIGIPIYILYTPRTEIATLKKDFYSTEAIFARSARTEKVFLGYAVRLIRKAVARRSKT